MAAGEQAAELAAEAGRGGGEARETPAWAGGLKQQRDAEERREALARGGPRVTRDAELRARVRFGDPMAHLVRSEAPADPAPVVLPGATSSGRSGFVVPQEVSARAGGPAAGSGLLTPA